MDMHDRDGGVFAPDEGGEPYEYAPEHAAPKHAMHEHPAYVLDDYASYDLRPLDHGVVSGAELRRRLITPEALAAIDADVPRPSLLERLVKLVRRR